jgi:hypothetical protein
MVRELEIIFGLDPVAGHLGVASHRLVFLEQLGGVAALPIILTVAWTRRSARLAAWAAAAAAAPAAALTIVDQTKFLAKRWSLPSTGSGHSRPLIYTTPAGGSRKRPPPPHAEIALARRQSNRGSATESLTLFLR